MINLCSHNRRHLLNNKRMSHVLITQYIPFQDWVPTSYIIWTVSSYCSPEVLLQVVYKSTFSLICIFIIKLCYLYLDPDLTIHLCHFLHNGNLFPFPSLWVYYIYHCENLSSIKKEYSSTHPDKTHSTRLEQDLS